MQLTERRIVKRFDKTSREWIAIEMRDLKCGDIFLIFDYGCRYYNKETADNVWIASGAPYKDENGIWTIKTLY